MGSSHSGPSRDPHWKPCKEEEGQLSTSELTVLQPSVIHFAAAVVLSLMLRESEQHLLVFYWNSLSHNFKLTGYESPLTTSLAVPQTRHNLLCQKAESPDLSAFGAN